jgi:TIR domain
MTVMRAAEFDAFISYSRLDVVWARNLAQELSLLGLKPWIDEEQVKPGMLFASAIEEALDNCGAMLLIVSPQSVASGWVKEEYNRALSLTKERPSFQLIPLLLADAELPGFLRTRQWVDFRDESQYRAALYRVKWALPDGIQT